MFNDFLDVIKNNQTLLTALGLGGAGILTFWLKDIPVLFLRLLKREFTTSLTITNHNIVYYSTLKWICNQYGKKNFRYLKLTNGRWGEDKTSTLSIGFGTHFLRYKNHIWVIQLVKEEANQTFHDKEYMTITKIGRCKKIFDQFLEDVKKCDENLTTIKLYRYNENWEFVRTQNKRFFDTVFIEQNKKDELIQRLDTFISKEEWYLQNGIPYQLGILLYGPPGTGKTSLIKAISSYLNYPIYNIQTSKLLKIEEAFESLSEKCVVVVEDIDCQSATHSRENNEQEQTPKALIKKNGDIVSAIGLSEILNALDGVCSTDGRILIATTNYIEKLDPALIRPGRFDIKLKVDYVNEETFKLFMNKFFPETLLEKIQIKEKISMSILQDMVISGATPEQIIKNVCL